MSTGNSHVPGRHPSAPRRHIEIAFPTQTGVVREDVNNPSARSEVARYWNAVRRYLETGDGRKLGEFESKVLVLPNGRRLPFVTDRTTLDRLAEGGAVHFDLYRR
jgi:hypothetical protein